MKRLLLYTLLLTIGFSILPSCRGSRSATDSLVGSKPESHIWSRRKARKERKNDTAYNPYLHAKNKPSQQQAKENKKVMKQAKKAIRKEKRKLRRTKGAYKK